MPKLTINVPPYCAAFIDDLSEEQKDAFFSLLFDIALRHRLLEYPTLAIERNIERILLKVERMEKAIAELQTNGIQSINGQAVVQDSITDDSTKASGGGNGEAPLGEDDDSDLMR